MVSVLDCLLVVVVLVAAGGLRNMDLQSLLMRIVWAYMLSAFPLRSSEVLLLVVVVLVVVLLVELWCLHCLPSQHL